MLIHILLRTLRNDLNCTCFNIQYNSLSRKMNWHIEQVITIAQLTKPMDAMVVDERNNNLYWMYSHSIVIYSMYTKNEQVIYQADLTSDIKEITIDAVSDHG